MRILLWQDSKNLGKRGEVVEVKRGYAQNYLFPQRLASLPTPANRKLMETEKIRLAQQDEKGKQVLKALAQKIEHITCTIEARANKDGTLFGSITPQIIIEALQREGVTGLDPKTVVVETPIKELGVYRVLFNLHPEITTYGRFWVVEESGPEESKI